MIGDITIENFKSITKLELSLGRINVLIGANGCGKSNILEALALCSAAHVYKLDSEFLASRGVRLPDSPKLLTPAFSQQTSRNDISINIYDVKHIKGEEVNPENGYESRIGFKRSKQYISLFDKTFSSTRIRLPIELAEFLKRQDETYLSKAMKLLANETFPEIKIFDAQLDGFLIYSPANDALRTFSQEGQILPLGIRGEGLFKLLSIMSTSKKTLYPEVKERLQLIDWFEDFHISGNAKRGDRSLRIKDKYFDPALPEMSQRSSNEGFLFLLFYFCLFISDLTPKFFAVDNIDASLNPKLCARLMVQLTDLAKKHEKQAIFTTHNPAVLDGLNLDDDDQRLFVVYRNDEGHTSVKRVQKPTPLPGQKPVKLSEAFMRGYLGGLPDNF